MFSQKKQLSTIYTEFLGDRVVLWDRILQLCEVSQWQQCYLSSPFDVSRHYEYSVTMLQSNLPGMFACTK